MFGFYGRCLHLLLRRQHAAWPSRWLYSQPATPLGSDARRTAPFRIPTTLRYPHTRCRIAGRSPAKSPPTSCANCDSSLSLMALTVHSTVHALFACIFLVSQEARPRCVAAAPWTAGSARASARAALVPAAGGACRSRRTSMNAMSGPPPQALLPAGSCDTLRCRCRWYWPRVCALQTAPRAWRPIFLYRREKIDLGHDP